MAMAPGVCDECGAIFGAEILTGARGHNIQLGGARIGPCPSCGGIGSVPEGTFDLVDDTLRVVKAAVIDETAFNAIIEVLEDRAAGKATDQEVIAQVNDTVPELASTVKDYLAKSDPAAWLALLASILMILQSWSMPSPPSAEEIANAIWVKEHPRRDIPVKSKAGERAP